MIKTKLEYLPEYIKTEGTLENFLINNEEKNLPDTINPYLSEIFLRTYTGVSSKFRNALVNFYIIRKIKISVNDIISAYKIEKSELLYDFLSQLSESDFKKFIDIIDDSDCLNFWVNKILSIVKKSVYPKLEILSLISRGMRVFFKHYDLLTNSISEDEFCNLCEDLESFENISYKISIEKQLRGNLDLVENYLELIRGYYYEKNTYLSNLDKSLGYTEHYFYYSKKYDYRFCETMDNSKTDDFRILEKIIRETNFEIPEDIKHIYTYNSFGDCNNMLYSGEKLKMAEIISSGCLFFRESGFSMFNFETLEIPQINPYFIRATYMLNKPVPENLQDHVLKVDVVNDQTLAILTGYYHHIKSHPGFLDSQLLMALKYDYYRDEKVRYNVIKAIIGDNKPTNSIDYYIDKFVAKSYSDFKYFNDGRKIRIEAFLTYFMVLGCPEIKPRKLDTDLFLFISLYMLNPKYVPDDVEKTSIKDNAESFYDHCSEYVEAWKKSIGYKNGIM